MALPSQRRAEALEKAGKARDFLDTIDSVKDLQTRATVLHDRIADSVRDICGENGDVFTEPQIALLSDIAAHIVLLMDPSQKKPTKGLAKLRHEFRELSAIEKVAKLGLLVGLVVGIITIGTNGVTWAYKAYDMIAVPGVPGSAVARRPLSAPIPPNSAPNKQDQ